MSRPRRGSARVGKVNVSAAIFIFTGGKLGIEPLPCASMPLRVAVVGCGKIADGHVQEIQKLAGRAQLVAVCDKELLIAEQLARRYGVARHYDDLAQLLEREQPDVVHVTTPPQSHLRIG